eukprot:1007469_1
MAEITITKPDEPYDTYTLKDLRPYLEARGLRVSGKKAHRVADLDKWDAEYDQQQRLQQQQQPQQQQQSNVPTVAAYIANINNELGREAIDADTIDHLIEQHVSIAMFEDLCITDNQSLQKTFGIDLGAIWSIRKKLLSQQKTEDAHPLLDEQKQPNDTVNPTATDEQMKLYEQRVRFLCIGDKVDGKAIGIETPKLRVFISSKTQSVKFRNARSDKSVAEVMKLELQDLHANFLINLTSKSLNFEGNGGVRHWTGKKK